MPFPPPPPAGRVALVTGASSGIGRATAVALARAGMHVAVNYPTPAEREEAERTLRLAAEAAAGASVLAGFAEAPVFAGGDGAAPLPPGIVLEGDVSDREAVDRMFDELLERMGRLDVLVNNAGIQIAQPSTHESDPADFERVLAVNLRGPYLCARRALAHFVEHDRKGCIINVSSVHERIPRPHYPAYSASKSGLRGLTQTLALEYAARGIRVNAVAPGATVTPINARWAYTEEGRQGVAAHIPMGRVASAEEVAHAILLLASGDFPYATGQTLTVDGGLTLYADFQEPWSA